MYLADSEEAKSYIDFYRSTSGYRERADLSMPAAKAAVKNRVDAVNAAKTAAAKKAAALKSLRAKYAAGLKSARQAYSRIKTAKTAALKKTASTQYAHRISMLKVYASRINKLAPGSIKSISGTTSAPPAAPFSPGLLALAASYYLFF